MIVISFSVRSENPGLSKSKGLEVWYLGIGLPHAADIFAQYLRKKRPQFLIISGFAGALAPHIRTGETFLCENMSDPQAVQQLVKQGWRPLPKARLYTANRLAATAKEKARLYQLTNADLVDMESQSLFRLATNYSIPAITVRVVSDAAEMDFPVPENILYNKHCQRFRPLALSVYLTQNVRCIPSFVRWLRQISRARANLQIHLEETLGVIRHSNIPSQ